MTAAAAETPNDFHFSIIGDRTGGAQPGIYGRVWREVDLLHPDFVINVGDTIQGGNDGTAAAEWAELQPIREAYGYPWYFVAGNHDIWSAASEKIYQKETGRPAYYSFDYQNAHFTVLDNSRTEELSAEQLAYLDKDLSANRARSPKFVFFHRPYWALYLKMRSGAFPLHEIARKHGVNFIISGHAHFFMRMERDGIVYLGVGSSGASMERGRNSGLGFADGWFYHHVWVRVRGSAAQFTVKELDAPAGRGRMFRAEDWDTSGPRFNPADPAAGQPMVR
jgi:3',5'-cyclic AMP phosphodiesterase CpdA